MGLVLEGGILAARRPLRSRFGAVSAGQTVEIGALPEVPFKGGQTEPCLVLACPGPGVRRRRRQRLKWPKMRLTPATPARVTPVPTFRALFPSLKRWPRALRRSTWPAMPPRIRRADPALRRRDDSGTANRYPPLGEDHMGVLRRALDLVQVLLHPVARPGAEPPRRAVIGRRLIQFRTAELAEQKIARQGRRQPCIRPLIPQPQQTRPEPANCAIPWLAGGARPRALRQKRRKALPFKRPATPSKAITAGWSERSCPAKRPGRV